MEDGWTRRMITKLRSGTNHLRIEQGRWRGEAVEERCCLFCKIVEDEKHYVLECRLGDVARQLLLGKVTKITHDKDLFSWILGGFVDDGMEWENAIRIFFRDLEKARQDYFRFINVLK